MGGGCTSIHQSTLGAGANARTEFSGARKPFTYSSNSCQPDLFKSNHGQKEPEPPYSVGDEVFTTHAFLAGLSGKITDVTKDRKWIDVDFAHYDGSHRYAPSVEYNGEIWELRPLHKRPKAPYKYR